MAIVDYHNTGDSTQGTLTVSSKWHAQTFTASKDYDISSVKLKLFRTAGMASGTVTVSIRATTANLPSGGDLASGTFSTDSITTSSPGEFYEFTLSSPYSLTNGQVYAIVARDDVNDAVLCTSWRITTGNAYAGGRACLSSDSGSSWGEYSTNLDFLFETYESDAEYVDVTGTIAGVSSVTGDATTITAQLVTGTIAGVSSTSGNATVEANWQTDTFKNTKRLIIAGNDSIYYEDI